MPFENLNPNLRSALNKLVPEVFSKDIELAVQELDFVRFKNFLVVKEELERQPGDKIHIPYGANLRKAQNLSESSVLAGSGQRLQTTFLTMTPSERGDEIQISEYSKLAADQLIELVKQLLAQQSLMKENSDIKDVLFGSLANRYYTNNVAGTSSIIRTLDADDVQEIVERLKLNNAPYWDGNSYLAFISPYASQDLINDLVSTVDYAKSLPVLFKGEIGMYRNVRFVETSGLPQKIKSTENITSGGSAGITIVNPTGYSVVASLMKFSETFTFTYTASTDSWAISSDKSGARQVALFLNADDPNDPLKSPVVALASSYTDSNASTYKVAVAEFDSDGFLLGYSLILNPGAMTGAASDDTATLVVTLIGQTLVCGKRFAAMAILKNTTMLDAELFDYGRTIGFAWNAFWSVDWLHKNYAYVIEALR